MRRATVTTVTFLPALASAHFSILYPPTAITLAGEQAVTPPCGYGTPPSPSGTPHPFLASGSQLALSTHGEADWEFRYTTDLIPPAPGSGGNWSSLYRPVDTEGEGNFCLYASAADVDFGASNGTGTPPGIPSGQKTGWISVKAEMAEGTYYQCAYVNFVQIATLEFPTICANSTTVKISEDGDDDDDDDDHSTKTSKTTTSTKYSNSTMTTKTTTDTSGSTTVTTADPTDTTQGPDPGPSTITSTSIVVPTGPGTPPPGGSASTSGSIAVPTGAATNTKGSPLGMKGFSAVVLGAGFLCAALML